MRLRGVTPAERRARVDETASLLGLAPLLDRKPAQLSGGQRQRVALGRALVRDPVAFLLDEPLSNLDAKLRASMRTELVKLHRRVGRTIIHVTHDQVEAMTMAQRHLHHEGGPGRPGGHAAGGLSQPGQHLRRRLPGQPAHEPAGGAPGRQQRGGLVAEGRASRRLAGGRAAAYGAYATAGS